MKFLVTGATGRVGRYLVSELLENDHEVRALTRNPVKANLPSGTEVIAGDLTQPSTLVGAFDGVTGVHLINFGGNDGAPLQTGSELMAMAQAAGVQRVTVLRGGPEGELEAAVKASSLSWTFIEPVEFMSGALDYAESIRTTGMLAEPFADRRTAIVHDRDIAAVAARALSQDGHAGQSYIITGGEVLTPRKMVRIIAETLGRDIPFIELTEAQALEKWQAEGQPQELIDFMLWVYVNTPVEGYTVTPTVEQVTGRPPRTFAEWAAENIDAFRPAPEAAIKG